MDAVDRCICGCTLAAAAAVDDPALLEAIKKVSKATGERLKWDALEPTVSEMQNFWRKVFARQGPAVAAAIKPAWPAVYEAVQNPLTLRLRQAAIRAIQSRIHTALTGTPIDNAAIQRAMVQAQRAAARAIGEGLYGTSFFVKDKGAIAWAEKRAAWLVAEVNEATRNELRTLVTQGIEEGWSYDRTAKHIIEKFRNFGVARPQLHIATRAHLIAVTESATAYEQSHLRMARELVKAGIPMVKEWEASFDERDCPVCDDNSGEGPIALEAVWSDGSEAPPAHPACRCYMNTFVDPAADVPDLDALLADL